MKPIRSLLPCLFFLLLALPGTAQSDAGRTITVKDMVEASICRDLACFTRFATQKGYALADTLVADGSTTVIFLPSNATADEPTPELGITLPPRNAAPGTVPVFHFACYEEATFQRLLKELAAMGLTAENEPYEVGPGMMMTDYMPSDASDISAWTLTSELSTDDGTLTYYKLGIASLK